MIKVQLNNNLAVRISSTHAEFYHTSSDGQTYEPSFLTIPSHQISRINDLIKGLQNLAIHCTPTEPESPFKRSPNTLINGDNIKLPETN